MRICTREASGHGTTPAGTTRGAAVEFCVAAVRRHDSTAGRLAQASQVCKELLQARLAELKEQRSLAAEQAAQALRDRKRDLILSCFEPLEEGAIVYRCIIHHQTWGTTPCRSTLKVPYERVKLPLMLRHLQTVHPTEYGIMSSCLSCSTIDDGVPCPVRLMTTKWSSSGHMWQSQRNGPTGAAHRCPIV